MHRIAFWCITISVCLLSGGSLSMMALTNANTAAVLLCSWFLPVLLCSALLSVLLCSPFVSVMLSSQFMSVLTVCVRNVHHPWLWCYNGYMHYRFCEWACCKRCGQVTGSPAQEQVLRGWPPVPSYALFPLCIVYVHSMMLRALYVHVNYHVISIDGKRRRRGDARGMHRGLQGFRNCDAKVMWWVSVVGGVVANVQCSLSDMHLRQWGK